MEVLKSDWLGHRTLSAILDALAGSRLKNFSIPEVAEKDLKHY